MFECHLIMWFTLDRNMNRLVLARPVLNRANLVRPVLARTYISHRPSWADNTPVAPHEWGTKISVSSRIFHFT